jgi:hypothetical protein
VGDRGGILAVDGHFSASGVTGAADSDRGDSAPAIEDSPATPLRAGGAAPEPQLALSCYGWGGRAGGGTPHGVGAGPVVFDGLRRTSRGPVIRANAIVQPGGGVTVSIARRDRDHAGLLYGRAWRGAHRLANAQHTVRLEGCSDTTEGGGPARFDGGIVVTGGRCATLAIYVDGSTEPERRRVACAS